MIALHALGILCSTACAAFFALDVEPDYIGVGMALVSLAALVTTMPREREVRL